MEFNSVDESNYNNKKKCLYAFTCVSISMLTNTACVNIHKD